MLFSRGGIECRWCACLCAGTLKALPLEVDAAGPFLVEDETKVVAVEDSDETACATLKGDGWLIDALAGLHRRRRPRE